MLSVRRLLHWFGTLAFAVGASLVLVSSALAMTPGREDRVALVIGNARYKESPLENSVNDARDMAIALRRLGFRVIEKTDATQKEMNRAIAQFGELLGPDTVALFYYAGHGLQVRGKNFLIPVDALILGESSIRAEAVDVDVLLDQLGASSVNVVILDACRNNPYERRFRTLAGGLAQMDAPKGTLIAYSTAPGKTAADGLGRNGIYTQELLRHMQTPGLTVESVLKNVRRDVARATNDQQIPWESSSLTGEFYFVRGNAVTTASLAPSAVALPNGPPLSNVPPPRYQFAIEDEVWKAATDVNTVQALEAYLREFPDGRYALAAKLRIAGLKPTEGAAGLPAPEPAAAEPARAETARARPAAGSAPPTIAARPASKSGEGASSSPPASPAPVATNDKDAAAAKAPPANLAPQEQSRQYKDRKFAGDLVFDPATTLPTGRGEITWSDGSHYVGEIVKGDANGRGIETTKSGIIYEGEWRDGRRHGKGLLTLPNGDFWEGQFVEDRQVLTGQMRIKRGATKAEGNFTMVFDTGQLTGTGRVEWPNGDVYQGQLDQGRMHGRGKIAWANGQAYDGDWEHDVANGVGRFTFSNGDVYDGQVRNGQPHGQGVYTHKSGETYSGDWTDGKRHGHGRITLLNGDYWEGEFLDGKQTDTGRMYAAESEATTANSSAATPAGTAK